MIQVGVRPGDPPVRAAIDVFPRGLRVGSATVKKGWIRGHTNFAGSGGLTFLGEIHMTDDDPRVTASIRNDSGSEVSVVMQVSAFE